MSGLAAVFWKEMADYFGSRRFVILLAIIYLLGAWAIYNAFSSIRGAVEASALPAGEAPIMLLLFVSGSLNLVSVLLLVIPIIGIAFGFDAINSERSSGTLSRVLSQPIYRDSVVNGKFLAGLFTITTLLASIFLIVSGLGLRMFGVPPELEEIARLASVFLLTVLYGGFWLALAILFSLLSSRPATSALAAIAIWLLFVFFTGMIAQGIAGAVVPLDQFSPEAKIVQNQEMMLFISRLSPSTLYLEAVTGLLVPFNLEGLGSILGQTTVEVLPNPISFSQSFLLVWPQILSILVLTIICFAIAYVKFMREEIRAT